jgi:hypothetical protein
MIYGYESLEGSFTFSAIILIPNLEGAQSRKFRLMDDKINIASVLRKTNLFFCSLEELAEISLDKTKLIIDFGVRPHPLGQLTDRTGIGKPVRARSAGFNN